MRWLFLFFYFVLSIGVYAGQVQDYHNVEEGETLWGISKLYREYGFEDRTAFMNAIAELNEIDINKPVLKIGQQLKMPSANQKASEELREQEQSETTELVTSNVAPCFVYDSGKKDPCTVIENSDSNTFEKEKEVVVNEMSNAKSTMSLWFWMFLGVIIGLALGVLFVYFVFVKKLKAEIVNKEFEVSQLSLNDCSEKSNTEAKLSHLKYRIETLEKDNLNLLNENISLGEKLEQLRSLQYQNKKERADDTKVLSTKQNSTSVTVLSTDLYADAIIDDYLIKVRETPGEDSIFVLRLSGETMADFSLYQPAYQRILANPSFVEGCEMQITGNNLQLEVVSNGKARLESLDGKWKVIEKLKIIIK